MVYADSHLWEDSAWAGDIWKGRWSQQLLAELLNEHTDIQIPSTDYTNALHWLSNLTRTLQKTQTALYSTRRYILRHLDLLPTSTNVTLSPRTQTLFSAWNIPYSRGLHPPKRPPRYQGRCDLAPRRASLRQAVLGYRAVHSTSAHCHQPHAHTEREHQRDSSGGNPRSLSGKIIERLSLN